MKKLHMITKKKRKQKKQKGKRNTQKIYFAFIKDNDDIVMLEYTSTTATEQFKFFSWLDSDVFAVCYDCCFVVDILIHTIND